MKPIVRSIPGVYLFAVILLACGMLSAGKAQAAGSGWISCRTEAGTLTPEQALAGYAGKVFYPSLYASNSGNAAGRHYSGPDLALYTCLKTGFGQIAAGELTFTEFTLEPAVMLEQDTFTADELGVSVCVSPSGYVEPDAKSAVNSRLIDYLNRIVTAVIVDCPYEQYWYDKGTGWQFYWDYTGTEGSVTLTALGLRFYVSEAYQDYSSFTVDPSCGQRIRTALQNAEAVVEACSALPDEAKLRAYRDAVCDRTDYNDDAWADGQAQLPYGDPWQLVWVFDGDSETKVVCEGYSKAFQYLCERSSFTDVRHVISVTGILKGLGGHMWNIVQFGDGSNVLADITNCDNGDAGHDDELFLADCLFGSPEDGYSYRYGNELITYIYYDRTLAACAAEDLVMRGGISFGLRIPDGVTAIADEAFAGSGAVGVYLPSGLVSIGRNAFGSCTGLRYIYVQDGLTAIDPAAFGKGNLTLIVPYESPAMTFAQENEIDYIVYAAEEDE